MKKRFLTTILSIVTVLSLVACTENINIDLDNNINATPDPHAQLTGTKETDTPEAVAPDPSTDVPNPEPEPNPETDPDPEPTPDIDIPEVNGEDPETVPISYEYGSLLDNVLFASYDRELEEVTKYQFFYVDENLYFEETWGGYYEDTGDEYVMSYFAGEIFVEDEKDISYSNGKLTIPCIIKRFSSFSMAGEYWDEGLEATITYDKDKIKIEYSDDEAEGYIGTRADDNTLYDTWYTFDTFQEMNPGYGYNTNMEYMDDWWYEEGDTHYYIRMYPNGTIAFITKTPGSPVDLQMGYWGWDGWYDDGDDYYMHIAWLTSQIGYANMPYVGTAYIKIENGDLYFMEDLGDKPDMKNPQIYKSKWYLSGRQCPIDYFAIY